MFGTQLERICFGKIIFGKQTDLFRFVKPRKAVGFIGDDSNITDGVG